MSIETSIKIIPAQPGYSKVSHFTEDDASIHRDDDGVVRFDIVPIVGWVVETDNDREPLDENHWVLPLTATNEGSCRNEHYAIMFDGRIYHSDFPTCKSLKEYADRLLAQEPKNKAIKAEVAAKLAKTKKAA